jgi:hypothetical protein
MFNIFIVISATLAYAFFDPIFFVAHRLDRGGRSVQAVYMANAGGADNAKKVVEVNCTRGHAAHDARSRAIPSATQGTRRQSRANPIVFTTCSGCQ